MSVSLSLMADTFAEMFMFALSTRPSTVTMLASRVVIAEALTAMSVSLAST